MERPRNTDLPFFAYGLFRPGQLAFFQLRDLVNEVIDPASIQGTLLLRDGLPIIHRTSDGTVDGALMTFVPGQTINAYDRISTMEPEKQYRWDVANIDGASVNVLVGLSPNKGSVPCEEPEWNGWNDPMFTAALDVVDETLRSPDAAHFAWDCKPLFKLQMAYLLLWSSIERYVSLRYSLGDNVMAKVARIANEPAFGESLAKRVSRKDHVYRANSPKVKESLDPNCAIDAVGYYYQIRCNITHRGKGMVRDYDRVKESLSELLMIFRDVLAAAQRDAARLSTHAILD